jgi:hypothetical protein
VSHTHTHTYTQQETLTMISTVSFASNILSFNLVSSPKRLELHVIQAIFSRATHNKRIMSQRGTVYSKLITVIVGVVLLVSSPIQARVDPKHRNCTNSVITPPSNFHLDVEGSSVSSSDHHICVLEKKVGVDVGGKAVCWGDEYTMDGAKLVPPADVSIINS